MAGSREVHATARSAAGLTVVSLLSPVAGLAVEIALAWRFGTSATTDAFRTAALLIIFAQQVFTVAVLPHVVVPLFAHVRGREGERRAWDGVLRFGGLALMASTGAAVVVALWPRPLVNLLGPGLSADAGPTAELLVRWFAVAYVPFVWSGILAGLLYAYGIFWVPPISQLLGNVMLALAILVVTGEFGPVGLVAGVVIGAVTGTLLHMLRVLPLLRRAGLVRPVAFGMSDPAVRRGIRMSLPLLAGVLVLQYGTVFTNRLLSELPTGTLAAFGYAWKMGQLVFLIPAALATVLFPRLAERSRTDDAEAFRQLCTRALRMAMFIAIPLTSVCFALRLPLVELLFQRGDFSAESATMTARLFGVLLLNTPGSVVFAYLQKMLFAKEDMYAPTSASVIGMVVLTVAAPPLAALHGADGVAVACVAVPWAANAWLVFTLDRKYHAIRLRELATLAIGILPLAAGSAWLGHVVAQSILGTMRTSLASLVIAVAGGGLTGMALFSMVAVLLRVPEALQGWDYLEWQGANALRTIQRMVHG